MTYFPIQARGKIVLRSGANGKDAIWGSVRWTRVWTDRELGAILTVKGMAGAAFTPGIHAFRPTGRQSRSKLIQSI